MTRDLRLLAAAAAVACAAGCASGPATIGSADADDPAALPRRDWTPPLHERASYAATFNGFPVGSLVYEVHPDPVDAGLRVFEARVSVGEGTALPVRVAAEATSVYGASDLRTRRYTLRLEQAGVVRRASTDMDPAAGTVRSLYLKEGEEPRRLEARMARAVDPLLLPHLLRHVVLETGRTFVFDVVYGADAYRATCEVRGRERVRVAAGEFDAVEVRMRIDALTGPPPNVRQVDVLFQDGGPGLPLRVRFGWLLGTAAIALERYEEGEGR